MMVVSPTGVKFFRELILSLEGLGAVPIALRNYTDFPEIIGNDFDLFVHPKYLGRSVSILDRLVKSLGGEVTHVHRRNYFVALWIEFPDTDLPIHLDFYHGPQQWHGMSYLGIPLLNHHRRLFFGSFEFYIPAPEHEAMMLLLSNLLWGGRFKTRYREDIRMIGSDEGVRDRFLALLNQVFGSFGVSLGESILCDRQDINIEHSTSKRLRWKLFKHCFYQSPLKWFRGWSAHWNGEVRSYLWEKPGMTVRLPDSEMGRCAAQRISIAVGSYFGETLTFVRGENPLISWWRRFRALGKNQLLFEYVDTESDRVMPEELVKTIKAENLIKAQRVIAALA